MILEIQEGKLAFHECLLAMKESCIYRALSAKRGLFPQTSPERMISEIC